MFSHILFRGRKLQEYQIVFCVCVIVLFTCGFESVLVFTFVGYFHWSLVLKLTSRHETTFWTVFVLELVSFILLGCLLLYIHVLYRYRM